MAWQTKHLGHAVMWSARAKLCVPIFKVRLQQGFAASGMASTPFCAAPILGDWCPLCAKSRHSLPHWIISSARVMALDVAYGLRGDLHLQFM